MKRSERDFIALFCASWYKDFPVASGREELGKRALWTIHIGSVVKQCADLWFFLPMLNPASSITVTCSMPAAELANQNGLAGSGGKEVKERGLGLNPLAGFDMTTIGRF